ncbi:zinc finger protein 70 [Hippocampus zosterae]|uniref:zinc finger protein 70 n=1 Tax=Hippocampus zosterae TaxID=109293 RepID=UPI00223D1862|nr:zinc finger protein 70 [Hippocampus zosterae]
MSHYTSHNITATCHICNITFRHLSTLSLHLDNAHCPPVCWKCSRSFSNVWDLNKHAEEHCSASTDERSDLASDMELATSLEKSENSADYKPGRSLDSDDVSTDESTSSATGDDIDFDFKAAQGDLSDAESDEDTNSSSTESADFADHASRGKSTLPAIKDSICKECGRGPFRSIKLHLRHCTSLLGKTFQCFRCKMFFPNEAALNEHRTFLYSCDVCGQVFSNWDAHHQHQPPNRGRLCLICFCSESMPKACAICKSFFVNEKFLLAHVTRVHTSVVSTKLCIINKPLGLTDNEVSMNAVTKTTPKVVINTKHIIGHGQLPADHTYSFSDEAETSHPDPSCSASRPTILALLENQSQELASTKRTKTRRCSRMLRTCRQCGTILRQPYLAISHRYLHRGSRSHRCQCGRAFKHRLHLLRHRVQHAEAKNYICVNCGNTFTGARLLAEHLKGKTRKKKQCQGSCRMPLACSCGHFFYRASAYIWHQIKNNVKTRHFENICK